MQVLPQVGVECSDEGATLLCNRYDSDGDGKLSFWEFAKIFIALEHKDEIESRLAVKEQGVSAETQQLVRSILQLSLEQEDRIECVRTQISRDVPAA